MSSIDYQLSNSCLPKTSPCYCRTLIGSGKTLCTKPLRKTENTHGDNVHVFVCVCVRACACLHVGMHVDKLIAVIIHTLGILYVIHMASGLALILHSLLYVPQAGYIIVLISCSVLGMLFPLFVITVLYCKQVLNAYGGRSSLVCILSRVCPRCS